MDTNNILLIIVSLLWILFVIYLYLRIRQTDEFTNFMYNYISEVHQRRIGGDESADYPNVFRSYNKLSKTWPWNYNFASMIVK